MIAAGLLALSIWAAVLLLPSRPFSSRERLEPVADCRKLDNVAVIVPARNEAAVIEKTVAALARQGPNLEIVIVDDRSSDATREIVCAEARRHSTATLNARETPATIIVDGNPLRPGWGGTRATWKNRVYETAD